MILISFFNSLLPFLFENKRDLLAATVDCRRKEEEEREKGEGG